ncbi:MAG: tyrosine-type recombinase/integrase [Gammaproteobacteria bacterium]|nr:tyrosine-type recombinase/integrase [Gammaproteobacteria bacterium]
MDPKAPRNRSSRRLSNAKLRNAVAPGKYRDGDGLFLLVKASGRRTWVQRITVDGRRRDIGLGPYPLVSLAEARRAVADNRRLVRGGKSPLTRRRSVLEPTFREAAATVIDLYAETWRNAVKSRQQWEHSLSAYAFPVIGGMKLSAIETSDVLRCLTPIWNVKRETAMRVRQRIRAVMQWAIASGYRTDNPAGDVLQAALPMREARRRKHHAALPHSAVAGAIAKVRASKSRRSTIAAFEFLVLTACRSGEVRNARWDDVDMEGRVWTVPETATKSGRMHRVPLADRTVEVLEEMIDVKDSSGLVFPSATGKVLSDNTLSKMLRDLGVPAVPHGFRSSFRDWCSEYAQVPREVAEAALAHVVKDSTEAAYARSTMFGRRAVLMQGWADYLNQARDSGGGTLGGTKARLLKNCI